MISCHQHDYIEIACLYRLSLRLYLISGSSVEGRATDTGSKDGQEWIKMETLEGARTLNLDELKAIEAIDDNPHFHRVELT